MGGRHRVLVGGFSHELNSFVPGVSTTETLARAGAIVHGDDIFGSAAGEGLERHAIAAVAAETGVELIPSTFMFGRVGPVVADDAYAPIRDSILATAREHRDEIDGVMLPLHGAMATESISDTEGDILHAVREIVGPDIPIAASFDMHSPRHGADGRQCECAGRLPDVPAHRLLRHRRTGDADPRPRDER